MLTDYELARYCQDLYQPQASPVQRWQEIVTTDGSYCAHASTVDCDIVCWRGSITANDWLEDVKGIPISSPLGFVHDGFWKGVDAVWPHVRDWANPFRKTYVIGHSLGAAHAMIYAGRLYSEWDRHNLEVVVWGEPRPGFAQLATILWPVQTRSYRNRQDPVTEVPKFCDFAGKDRYVHPKPLIPVDVAPAPGDLSPLKDHHFALYLAAMQKQQEGKAA